VPKPHVCELEVEEEEAGKEVVLILYVPLATWDATDDLVGTAMVLMWPQTSV
jgi:hypothetical protein